MSFKNGQNAKDNGCIYNPFSIQPILLNNWFNNIRNSKLLTQHGDIQCNKQVKVF